MPPEKTATRSISNTGRDKPINKTFITLLDGKLVAAASYILPDDKHAFGHPGHDN